MYPDRSLGLVYLPHGAPTLGAFRKEKGLAHHTHHQGVDWASSVYAR
jgi:hypothetical protein